MHKFTGITIEMTAICNYNCLYCYQKKRKIQLSKIQIKKFIDHCWNHLENDCYINLFGGEPLLEIKNIKWALEYIREKEDMDPKNVKFSTTTNGSLITHKILELFNEYRFEMLLSFDGLAQEIERQPGSFKKIVDVIKKIQQYPDIDLETNSVFTTRTILMLSDSLQFISSLGVSQISHTLNSLEEWEDKTLNIYQDQLKKTSDWILDHYKTHKAIPVNLFRVDAESERNSGIFSCTAGEDRIAIAPDSSIWGCHRIADYFLEKRGHKDYNKYCFGSLDEFTKKHKKIYRKKLIAHEQLKMDHFWTDEKLCSQCEELHQCSQCPFSTNISQVVIGKIPTWICRIKHIEKQLKTSFQERLKSKISSDN